MSLVAKELGELLVDIGLLNPADWDVVIREYEKTLEPISGILARLRLLTEGQLKDTLELQYGVPFFNLSKNQPLEAAGAAIRPQTLKLCRAIPVNLENGVITLALVKPTDRAALNLLKEQTPGLQIKLMVCMEDDFLRFIGGLIGKVATTDGAPPQKMVPPAERRSTRSVLEESLHAIQPQASAKPPAAPVTGKKEIDTPAKPADSNPKEKEVVDSNSLPSSKKSAPKSVLEEALTSLTPPTVQQPVAQHLVQDAALVASVPETKPEKAPSKSPKDIPVKSSTSSKSVLAEAFASLVPDVVPPTVPPVPENQPSQRTSGAQALFGDVGEAPSSEVSESKKTIPGPSARANQLPPPKMRASAEPIESTPKPKSPPESEAALDQKSTPLKRSEVPPTDASRATKSARALFGEPADIEAEVSPPKVLEEQQPSPQPAVPQAPLGRLPKAFGQLHAAVQPSDGAMGSFANLADEIAASQQADVAAGNSVPAGVAGAISEVHAVEEPVADSTPEAVAEAIDEAVGETIDEAVAEAIDEAVAEAIDEAVAEAIDEAVAETIDEALAEAIDEAVAEAIDEAVAETIDEALTEAIDEAVAEAIAEAVEQDAAEIIDEVSSGAKTKIVDHLRVESRGYSAVDKDLLGLYTGDFRNQPFAPQIKDPEDSFAKTSPISDDTNSSAAGSIEGNIERSLEGNLDSSGLFETPLNAPNDALETSDLGDDDFEPILAPLSIYSNSSRVKYDYEPIDSIPNNLVANAALENSTSFSETFAAELETAVESFKTESFDFKLESSVETVSEAPVPDDEDSVPSWAKSDSHLHPQVAEPSAADLIDSLLQDEIKTVAEPEEESSQVIEKAPEIESGTSASESYLPVDEILKALDSILQPMAAPVEQEMEVPSFDAFENSDAVGPPSLGDKGAEPEHSFAAKAAEPATNEDDSSDFPLVEHDDITVEDLFRKPSYRDVPQPSLPQKDSAPKKSVPQLRAAFAGLEEAPPQSETITSKLEATPPKPEAALEQLEAPTPKLEETPLQSEAPTLELEETPLQTETTAIEDSEAEIPHSGSTPPESELTHSEPTLQESESTPPLVEPTPPESATPPEVTNSEPETAPLQLKLEEDAAVSQHAKISPLRIKSLFQDDDDDDDFSTDAIKEPEPVPPPQPEATTDASEPASSVQALSKATVAKPLSAKSLFHDDDDDQDDDDSSADATEQPIAVAPPTVQAEKDADLQQGNDSTLQPPAAKALSAKSLFHDDDDDFSAEQTKQVESEKPNAPGDLVEVSVAETPVKNTVAKSLSAKSLFHDDDDDEEDFSVETKQVAPEKLQTQDLAGASVVVEGSEKEKPTVGKQLSAKSLFHDDDDDDDFFNEESKPTTSQADSGQPQATPTPHAIPVSGNVSATAPSSNQPIAKALSAKSLFQDDEDDDFFAETEMLPEQIEPEQKELEKPQSTQEQAQASLASPAIEESNQAAKVAQNVTKPKQNPLSIKALFGDGDEDEDDFFKDKDSNSVNESTTTPAPQNQPAAGKSEPASITGKEIASLISQLESGKDAITSSTSEPIPARDQNSSTSTEEPDLVSSAQTDEGEKTIVVSDRSSLASFFDTSLDLFIPASEQLTAFEPDESFLKEAKPKHKDTAELAMHANEIISRAIELRCSDLHIEPDEQNILIRFLNKGNVAGEEKLPKQEFAELTDCYKEMAGMTLTVKDRPQDKRFVYKSEGTDVNLRVTSIPGDFGETIAITFKF